MNNPDNYEITDLSLIDIYKGIEQIRYPSSSSNDIFVFSKRPVDRLLYAEIMKHSKEDLQNFKLEHTNQHALFDITVQCGNSFLFSAFIKKGAFINKLSNVSKKVLSYIPEPPLSLSQRIFNLLPLKTYQLEKDNSHYEIINYLEYCSDLNNDNKINLVKNLYKDFGKEYHSTFVEYIFETAAKNPPLNNMLLNLIKQNNNDINDEYPLNKLLPKCSINKQSFAPTSFFVSSSEYPKIKQLLDYGFHFDEKNYIYHNENLFNTLLESRQHEFLKLVLPYIAELKPLKMTSSEQKDMIYTFNNQSYFKDLEYKYLEYIHNELDKIIPNKKSENNTKLKI